MKYLRLFENKLETFLEELDSFGLDKKDYAIFGSGPLAVRGIINNPTDLDVIVREDVYKWDISPIVIGNIEFSCDWPGFEERIDELIDTSEMIDGYPYVKLKYVEEYKNSMHRKKDDQHLIYLYSKRLTDYIDGLEKKDKKNDK